MNASAIKDLHFDEYLKIYPKLHDPLGAAASWFVRSSPDWAVLARALAEDTIVFLSTGELLDKPNKLRERGGRVTCDELASRSGAAMS